MRDFVENLKPISIPNTKHSMMSSKRLPPLSLRMILDCCGSTRLWYPKARRPQLIAKAKIDSTILRSTLIKSAQAGPPLPGRSKSTPP